MKSQVLHTVRCDITGGAAGEVWTSSLSGVKGLTKLCGGEMWRKSKTDLRILQILLGGLMEVTSLCYLCLVVQTVLPVSPDVFVLLMCSVSLAPAMWQVVKMRSSWSTRGGKQQTLIFTVATACSLQGMVIFSYKVSISRLPGGPSGPRLRLHAVPFFSLSNWETGAIEMLIERDCVQSIRDSISVPVGPVWQISASEPIAVWLACKTGVFGG